MSSVGGVSSGSHGFSGLASGMDTESLVEKLLASTQAKIDREKAQNQQTEWKQEMYLEIIASLKSFQSNFFNVMSDTSLTSSSFFNSVTSSIIGNSNAIKVNAKPGAQAGNITIDEITRLASGSKTTSGSSISGSVGGTIDPAKLSELEQKITINGTEIDFAGAKNIDEAAKKINDAGSGTGVTATVEDGKIKLTSTAGADGVIAVDGTKMGLEMIGVSNSYAKKGETSIGFDADKGKPSLTLNVDGVERTIVLDPAKYMTGGSVDNQKLEDELNLELQSSFGSGVTADVTGGKLNIVGASGRHVTVVDGTAMEGLGTYKGQSNKINLNSSIGSLNLGKELQGKEFEFEINGVKIKASASDRIGDVINRVNNSDAGVTMSYSSITDTFSLESKAMGAGVVNEIKDVSGNLMSSIFGGTSGSSVVGDSVNKIDKPGSVVAENGQSLNGIKKGTFEIVINGKTAKLELPAKEDGTDYSEQEILDSFNEQLETKVGLDKDGNALVSLGVDAATGKISINTKAGYTATIPASTGTDDIGSKLGFTADQTTAPTGEILTASDLGFSGDIKVNGNAINPPILGTDTIDQMIDKVNGALNGTGTLSFDPETSSFKLETTDSTKSATLSGGDIDKMFGSETVSTNTASGGASAVVVAGQSAEIKVNGVVMEKNTNSFEIDGIQIELVQTSTEAITINTVGNQDQVVEGVEKFVNDYNKLVEDLNKLLDAKPDYKDYPPLTAEEKKEMTESEIKLWEDKAKTGLLRGDSIVTDILTDLRSVLYQKPEGSSIALYDIGIETGSYKENGKLHFDKEKFEAALKANPEEVEKLFTAPDGISKKLDAVLDKAVSARDGSLIEQAGPIKGDKDNSMYKKIDEGNDRIKDLERKYEMEKSRYWREFNAMEQAISAMNQQSSWLTQQMM